jgi:phosphate transport system permease protein
MSDQTMTGNAPARVDRIVRALTPDEVANRTRARNSAEVRFKAYGLIAIIVGLLAVATLFTTIIGKGYTAFQQTAMKLDVFLDPAVIDPTGNKVADDIMAADYATLANDALLKRLWLPLPPKEVEAPAEPATAEATTDAATDATTDTGTDPAATDAATPAAPAPDAAAEAAAAKIAAIEVDASAASDLLSRSVDTQIRDFVLKNPTLIGTTQPIWVLAHGNADALVKGAIDRAVPEESRQLSDKQIGWLDKLISTGSAERQFNWGLFSYGASSQPESAGIGVALIGSMYMMLTVLLLAVPLGVAAAIYLEEFAPKNRFTYLVEVNINNLAAVPSIVFGLLGLAIFINFAGLPRSAAIVGGLVLTLMTLPTIIIAARAAITAVPPSIREAALGVGASKMQSILHHVVPLAFPGILTGTIIGLAKALGETAPLLMIGMVAFVVNYPSTPLDPSTALPVQIFMWAGAAERGFVERTSGATMILLLFLACMNLVAVILRRRFERKW